MAFCKLHWEGQQLVKRAAFEAQTYLVATLRQNVERGEEAPHKIALLKGHRGWKH